MLVQGCLPSLQESVLAFRGTEAVDLMTPARPLPESLGFYAEAHGFGAAATAELHVQSSFALSSCCYQFKERANAGLLDIT
jgi:hypothetical protein